MCLFSETVKEGKEGTEEPLKSTEAKADGDGVKRGRGGRGRRRRGEGTDMYTNYSVTCMVYTKQAIILSSSLKLTLQAPRAALVDKNFFTAECQRRL